MTAPKKPWNYTRKNGAGDVRKNKFHWLQKVDHVTAYIAVFAAGEVAVVALLEVDAQFAGDFKLHVVQGAPGFGHVDPAAGIAARLVHCFSPPSFRIDAIFTDPGENTLAFCANRQIIRLGFPKCASMGSEISW